PCSVVHGSPPHPASGRGVAAPPSSCKRSSTQGSANGTTSTGSGTLPSPDTTLDESAMITRRRDARATTFSRSSAPTSPLMTLVRRSGHHSHELVSNLTHLSGPTSNSTAPESRTYSRAHPPSLRPHHPTRKQHTDLTP